MEKFDIINKIKVDLEIIYSLNPEYLGRSFDWTPAFSDFKSTFHNIINDTKFLHDGLVRIQDLCAEDPEVRLNAIAESIDNLKTFLQHVGKNIGLMLEIKNPTRADISSYVDSLNANANLVHFYNKFKSETNYLKERIRLERENKKLSEEKEVKAVGQYIALFDDRIDAHKKAAIRWMWVTLATTLVTIALFTCLVFFHESQTFVTEDYLNFFEHIAIRGTLIAFLVYLIHFSARAYRLNKNQQIINQDKMTALKSFEDFDFGSRDNTELHSAILLQVTNAIFAHRPNGYIDTKDEINMGPVSEALQLVKDSRKQ